jgi:ketosteroid isomerase-like protein
MQSTEEEGSIMSPQLRIALAITVFALACTMSVSIADAQQKPLTADERQIVDTVSTIFAAARTDDVAKFDSVIASDFYIFDGGARFNGDTVMAFIKAQHAAGKRYEWNVTEPDVHVSGITAWIAYTNKGSITDASGTINQEWLESAFLEKQAGAWKIVFMHSTRVPAQPRENHAALHALPSIFAQ